MNKRFVNMLLPALGAVLIPQLLFFWIAPAVRCRILVYPTGTILTIANAALCVWCLDRFGLRRSAGLIALGYGLTFAALATSALLLAFDASLRTTGFAMAIAAVIYAACMVPMIGTTEPDGMVSDDPPGPAPSSEPDPDPVPDIPDYVLEMRDNFVEQAPRAKRPAPPALPKRTPKTPPPPLPKM